VGNYSAIILAGGQGTRLREALPGTPKVLAPVEGRPFLELILEHARRSGAAELILCLSHEAGRIRRAVGETFGGLPVRYTEEAEPLGTGGAIRLGLAESAFPWSLVLNGDSFCGVAWPELTTWYEKVAYPLPALVATRVPDCSRYGRVELDGEGKVQCFKEKDAVPGPGLVNAGIYLLPRCLAAAIPADKPVSWEREILPLLASSGLWACLAPGPFLDIGTPESYAAAAPFFKKMGEA
jgi:NDP-sugar pyrophosphorylase family protein